MHLLLENAYVMHIRCLVGVAYYFFRLLFVVNVFLVKSELIKAYVGSYHYSSFHYFTSAYPVQFEHFLEKPQTGC